MLPHGATAMKSAVPHATQPSPVAAHVLFTSILHLWSAHGDVNGPSERTYFLGMRLV